MDAFYALAVVGKNFYKVNTKDARTIISFYIFADFNHALA